MARIVGGIGASHSPQIGFAKDTQQPDAAGWGPIFDVFRPVTEWLAATQPDVLVHIYNDHITSFFFDHYSPFVLGVDDRYVPADEGGGARAHPPVAGHPALARHIGASMFADHFDLSFFRNRPIDHGLFSPLSMMTDRGTRWNGAVIPLQVGTLQFPIPTARRCFDFGAALGRAVESFEEDLRVAVVATGGLSHQVHGERCGFNNTEWDERFLDLLEHDPGELAEMTHAQFAALGGMEGSEVILWLIMRGALADTVRCVHRASYLPSMTNLATVVYEHDRAVDPAIAECQRRHADAQLDGIEALPGTYPFTLARAEVGYRLNTFLHALTVPAVRERYRADAAAVYDEYALHGEERRLLEARDWIGLIRAGAIFFGLEKLAGVLGLANVDLYAQMRGQSLEEFQRTRRVALRYSPSANLPDANRPAPEESAAASVVSPPDTEA